MYLMDHQAPSYRTFGYFINEVLADSIEEIFQDINKKIFETEHVDPVSYTHLEKNSEYICLTYENDSRQQGTEIILDYDQCMGCLLYTS